MERFVQLSEFCIKGFTILTRITRGIRMKNRDTYRILVLLVQNNNNQHCQYKASVSAVENPDSVCFGWDIQMSYKVKEKPE